MFFVEAIRNKLTLNNSTFYEVKWLGYPEDSNTVEPAENLQDSHSLIKNFENSLLIKTHKLRKLAHKSNDFIEILDDDDEKEAKKLKKLSIEKNKEKIPLEQLFNMKRIITGDDDKKELPNNFIDREVDQFLPINYENYKENVGRTGGVLGKLVNFQGENENGRFLHNFQEKKNTIKIHEKKNTIKIHEEKNRKKNEKNRKKIHKEKNREKIHEEIIIPERNSPKVEKRVLRTRNYQSKNFQEFQAKRNVQSRNFDEFKSKHFPLKDFLRNNYYSEKKLKKSIEAVKTHCQVNDYNSFESVQAISPIEDLATNDIHVKNMAPLLLNDSEDNKTDVETNGLSSKTDKSSGFIIEKSKESKENQLPLHQIIKLINPDNLVSIRKAAKANENPFIHIFKRGGFKKKKKTFRFANRDLKGKIIRVKGLIVRNGGQLLMNTCWKKKNTRGRPQDLVFGVEEIVKKEPGKVGNFLIQIFKKEISQNLFH